jgi:hypothetical protein
VEEEAVEGLHKVSAKILAEYVALEDEHASPMNFMGLDIADKKTSAGKEGNAVSTQRVYKRINTFYISFLAELDAADHVVLCADIYLPGKANFVNRMVLVRHSIRWYITQTSPTRRGPILGGGPLVYVAGKFSKWTSLTQRFLLLRGRSPHYFSRQESGCLGTSF